MDDPQPKPKDPVSEPFSIICLSSQRWASALPTNRQQIMIRAARRGHPVLFVETSDFVAKRLIRERRPPAPATPVEDVQVVRLHNLAPFSQGYTTANEINFRLGGVAARRAARALPRPRVLWIYDPRGAAAIGSFGEDLVAYDCVDDYAEQTRGSRRARELVSHLDSEVARRADVTFATTEALRRRHERAGANVHLVPNVGDFDHFRPAADRAFADPELERLPRPVLGFAGNIIETKVDLGLVDQLAAAYPEATVLLIGPAEESMRARLDQLLERPNVRWTGLRPYASLPAAVAAFDVALVPYVVNDYTRSVFPLKIYEYLAAGKPVVAAGVPSVAGLRPHVALAETADEFVAAVGAAATADGDAKNARIELAASNTWDDRAETLLSLIAEKLQHAPARRD